MNRRNTILLGIAVLLMLANLLVYLTGGLTRSISYDQTFFAVADTAEINTVTISGPEQQVMIQRTINGWSLNNQYMVDEGLRRLLFSILQRVQIRKPVEDLPENGMEVLIDGPGVKNFIVFSNPTKTRTYFYDPKTELSYEVEIPGYNDYLGSIFGLAPNQWRDRMILDENWRTIKSLTLDYTPPSRQNVTVTFDNQFFVVPGVNHLDTARLIDYLNQFQVFEVNELIAPEDFPIFDSLSHTKPLATLEIASIKSTEPHVLMIFPTLGKDQFQLIKNRSGQLMVIDTRRLNQILIEQVDFQLKD